MCEQLVHLAAESPSAPALIDGNNGGVTTRAALLDRGRALAAKLSAAGVARRDLLAVQLPNSVDFVAAWLAALDLKLVFVPIDRDAPETEVASILSHFGVKALVYRPDRSSAEIAITTRTVSSRPPLPENA